MKRAIGMPNFYVFLKGNREETGSEKEPPGNFYPTPKAIRTTELTELYPLVHDSYSNHEPGDSTAIL
jgi:hypothetical protein